MQKYSFTPFDPVLAPVPGRYETIARPWRPTHPRYLFIDPPEGVWVESLNIGALIAAVDSPGELPARLFALRDVARLDLTTGAEATVVIDDEAAWPLALDLPPIPVGLLLRLRLRVDSRVDLRPIVAVLATPRR